MNTTAITFLAFLSMFIVIGVLSVLKSRDTTEDYLIASRNIHPFLASLSAAATNTSGYMFIGLIGFTYKFGLSSIWVTIGWITGDYFMWLYFYKKIRKQSEAVQAQTVPAFLGTGSDYTNVPIIKSAGIVTIVLLAVYSSAQLNAGGKALHVLFGWDYSTGAIIGAVIVFLYCVAGGIRASIWTDVTQAMVMLVSMSLLLGIAMYHTGGFFSLFSNLEKIDPGLMTLFPENLAFGPALYVLGWFAAGIGVIGQPHMQIRTMAINSPDQMKKARRAYFAWYIPFSAASVLVGLYSRIMIPDTAAFDPELALPMLSLELMPAIFVGLILAGLFAATMSTADSQILSCGAALTQDIAPKLGDSRFKTKLGTLFITTFSLGFALYGPKSVFALVTISWSALGAGLGPLMILRALKKQVSSITAILMILSGIATVLIWRYRFEYTSYIYEILPGIIAGFGVYYASITLKQIRQAA